MPLFSNKFCPKKPTPRKVELSVLNKELGPEKALQDLGLEIGPIRLKLGDQESLFDNGEWLPETGPVSGTHKENHKLRQYVQQLEDENNLLKLKYEILLDMLTQTTAESHLQEKQMEQLQKQVLNSSRIPRTKR
ncbi:chibby-like protein 1 [Cryptotermes secundus]|uniref:Chibby-like protein 1 n=2 Tax=Cryptotermes secundus TaxID=105785 RepID=A0A2J7PKP7_9NEOP|nr:chibby-like protein 1 [Cryptotermes secundus]